MTPDEKIAAFLTAAAPAREPAFNAEVMQRVARAEFRRAMAMVTAAAVLVGLVMWALAPVLATALVPLAQSLSTAAVVLVVTLSILAMGEAMFRRA